MFPLQIKSLSSQMGGLHGEALGIDDLISILDYLEVYM